MAKTQDSRPETVLTATELTELVGHLELLRTQITDVSRQLEEHKLRINALEGDYAGPGCFKVSDLINNMTPSNLYVTALQGAIAGYISSNPQMILSARRQTFIPQILQFAAEIVETANRSWEHLPERVPGSV